jgi:leader peptidase (prepilin peptidase)/N-methyltransferase
VRAAWDEAASISRRTFAAALLTSVFVAASLPSAVGLRCALVVAGWCFAAAALVDVAEQRLPNRLLGVASASAAFGAFSTHSMSLVVGSAVGATIAGGSMLLVRAGRGLGMGDVKMAAAMGLGLGSVHVIAAPLAIAVAAFAASLFGAMAHRRRLVLGPSLWLGWIVALGWACRWG